MLSDCTRLAVGSSAIYFYINMGSHSISSSSSYFYYNLTTALELFGTLIPTPEPFWGRTPFTFLFGQLIVIQLSWVFEGPFFADVCFFISTSLKPSKLLNKIGILSSSSSSSSQSFFYYSCFLPILGSMLLPAIFLGVTFKVSFCI